MDLQQHILDLRRQVGAAHRSLGQVQADSEAWKQAYLRQQNELKQLSDSLARIEASRSGDPYHIRYIEQIPGRRVPFDLMVQIPIGANINSTQQQPVTVSQDGPFVAVARFATFQSAYTFQIRDTQGNTAGFQGRSYGRFRPIHSAWDLNDGQAGYQPIIGAAFPGTGEAVYASPSNHSSFRSMEFDGVIQFQNQGSGYLRQNIPLPSSFYSTSINEPFSLGALDFFERGEVLNWAVTPLHVNNPPAGNVSGYALGNIYPFLDSQYDVQEGIMDPYIEDQTTDPATRLPNGILTIGFHGYKIIQPPGPVSL